MGFIPLLKDKRAILLFLCVIVAGFEVFFASKSPPFMVDAVEYAEVARNIIEHGEMREDHLRYLFDLDADLPHPAGQRATLYAVLLVPFYLFFGESYLVVVIPAILSHILLSLLVYRFGERFFHRHIAFWAAVLILFHPRLIYQISAEPSPDIFLALLFLLTTSFFLQKKYLAAGLFLGLTFLTKQIAIVLPVAFFLGLAILSRSEFKTRKLWAGLAVSLVVASPFFIRNMLVFGNPIYTEDMSDRGKFSESALEEGNILKLLLEFEGKEDDAQGSHSFFLLKSMGTSLTNLRSVFLGVRSVDRYPGFFELIFLPLAPFFVMGLFRARQEEKIAIPALVIFGLIFLHVFVIIGYEDRYLFSVLPLALFLAIDGLVRFGNGQPLFRPAAFLTFVLLTEGIFLIPLQYIHRTSNEEREVYDEYLTCCNWLARETPSDSIVMSYPPISTSYFSRRMAVPYPYGGLSSVKWIIDKFEVDYLLYTEPNSGEGLPYLDFLKPIAYGENISLFSVNRDSPSLRDLDRRYGYVRDWNPLETLAERAQGEFFKLDVPILLQLMKMRSGPIPGFLLYLFLLCLFCFLFGKDRAWFKIVAVTGLLLAFVLIIDRRVSQFQELAPSEPVPLYGVDLDQLERLLLSRLDPGSAKIAVIAAGPDEARGFAESLAGSFPHVHFFNGASLVDPDVDAILYPLGPGRNNLGTSDRLDRAIQRVRELDTRYSSFADHARSLRMTAERVRGAGVAFPAREQRDDAGG